MKKIAFDNYSLTLGVRSASQYAIITNTQSRVLSRKPAEIYGIRNKGTIEEGKHADFAIWDPFTSRKTRIDLRYADSHIFRDCQFLGSIEYTFLRGKCSYSRKLNTIKAVKNNGVVLERSDQLE